MQHLLFETEKTNSSTDSEGTVNAQELGQYFTPQWAAEELVHRFISEHKPDSLVEPSCGNGRFLGAIPETIPACGVEVDPVFAEQARSLTGRTVIEAQFQKVSLSELQEAGVHYPTHYIGNPPFELKVVLEFLDAIYDNSGRHAVCGFILPTYFFQTCNTVQKLKAKWGVSFDMIPRDLFPGLTKPIGWATLTKHGASRGFVLFDEKFSLNDLRDSAKKALNESAGSWRELVRVTLVNLGNTANLSSIYDAVSRSRVTDENTFWREKIRQTLQRYSDFKRVDRGIWTIAA